MPSLQYKAIDASSDVRTFLRGRAEVVTIGESIARPTVASVWA